jgi:stage II sporulation protein D (peptidoglycan lytic transglycosylase)
VRAAFPRKLLLVAWGLLTLTCNPAPPPEAPYPVQAPAGSTQPEIKIGLFVGSPLVEIGSDSEIQVMEGDAMGSLSHSSIWSVRVSGGRLELRDGSGASSIHDGPLTFVPSAGSLMSVAGRYYRGSASVFRDRTGLTVVNRVSMEDYLAGVISAEMGKREPADREALAAQAVISRTYALKNAGKRRSEGFDLYPTVVDQVYGGVWAETQLGWEAVRETTGQALTFNGIPIDAFFYSTCGGQTAAGTEVFVGANRPYLQSVSDLDEYGQAYCRLSPRYRWREEWTGDQLKTILRGVRQAPFREVRSVQVVARTASDRVARIAIGVDEDQLTFDGPAVRQILHPVNEPMLRSGAFTLTETREGRVVTGLVADGRGSGHGVGFCQWGAVGRARAGQDFRHILAAYFPGTSLERMY